MKNSIVYQVQQLLKQNKITFDKEELAFQIESHPSYPSLHAITGVLDHFDIDNLALDVPVNEETIKQLPQSFLAQVKTDENKEFVVIKNNGSVYEATYDSKRKSNLSLSEFLEKFTGILVAVEKEENIQENKKTSNTLLKKGVIISIILFTMHFALIEPSIDAVLFFITSLLGIYISYSIFKQEQGEESFLGNAFCSSESEKKNCDAVLTSKGAKIFDDFKLSNLSLLYFFGLALSIYLLSFLGTNFSFPFLISLLAIPVTIYSLYYQHAIIKQWCLLCLSIVLILWVQALIVVVNIDGITFSSLENMFIIGFSFSLAFIVGQYISSFIKIKNALRKTKVAHYKFKRNFNLFNALLEKSEVVNTAISTSEIIFGNKNSNLNITIITNPFCGHCRAVHTLVENLYKKYPNKIQLCVRFNVNANNPKSHAVKITSRLLELHEEDTTACLNAMHDIYEGEKPEKWLAKWKNCINPSKYIGVLKMESEWCSHNNINFTPEILISGKSFPKEYSKSDLLFFVEDLIEQEDVKIGQLEETETTYLN